MAEYATGNGDIVQGDINPNTLYGTNADQTATYSNLTINGAGGDDAIYGATMTASSAYGNAGDDLLDAQSSSGSAYYGGIDSDTLKADSSSGNTFYGDAGGDTFFGGTSLNATFYGGSGANVLYTDSASGAVKYYGGNDGDAVHGGTLPAGATLDVQFGTGNDFFFGNTASGTVSISDAGGADTYSIMGAAHVTITDSAGADSVYFDGTQNVYTTSTVGDTLTISSSALGQTVVTTGVEDYYFSDGGSGWLHYTFEELSTHVFYASSNADVVQGTIAAETFYGTDSTQTLQYENLIINAAGGNDTIYAGSMVNSSAYGNAGDDSLYAGTSVDSKFYGGTGEDKFWGDSSEGASFYGDGVLDTFNAGSSHDATFYGGAGVSVFNGESATGSVEFYGGGAGNTVNAGSLASGSTLNAYGGSGIDTFHANTADGMVNFYGGAGNDAYYADTAANVTVSDASGTDILYLAGERSDYHFEVDAGSLNSASLNQAGDVQVIYAQGIETFSFSDGHGGTVQYSFDQLAHEFYASANNQTIDGTAEPDEIHGTNESYSGEYTGLTLYGEGDNDAIYGGLMGYSTAYGGAGADYLDASSAYESVFYGGEGDDRIIGGGVDNTFYGDNGLDEISATTAEDATFYGGGGSNTFSADQAVGSVTYYGGDVGDIINAGSIGSGTNFSAYGGSGSDIFNAQGAAGIVNFYGGQGGDEYHADAATNVTIVDSGGTDSLYLDYSYSRYDFSFEKEIQAVNMDDTGSTQNVYAQGIEDFYFSNGDGSYTHYTYDELACFLAGTRIRTPTGEVAIETLKAGDLVLTTTGEAKPVLWLGRRAVATRFAHPLTALPIHIRPDALGRGLPERDLFVSPDHAFFIGGLLVQAGALVNGVTITRHRDLPETFTYYHVELEDHDLIFAEGLPAETFIDNQERETFDNAAEFPGRSRPAVELDLPRVKSRRQLPKVLARGLEMRCARMRDAARASCETQQALAG